MGGLWYLCDNSLLNKLILKLKKDCRYKKHRIIDNVSSASISQLPIFSFLLFCYRNALVRSLLESRSRQCSLHPRVGLLIDNLVAQLINLWQLIGWSGEASSKMNQL